MAGPLLANRSDPTVTGTNVGAGPALFELGSRQLDLTLSRFLSGQVSLHRADAGSLRDLDHLFPALVVEGHRPIVDPVRQQIPSRFVPHPTYLPTRPTRPTRPPALPGQ